MVYDMSVWTLNNTCIIVVLNSAEFSVGTLGTTAATWRSEVHDIETNLFSIPVISYCLTNQLFVY
jgi:hypothetical protein